MMKMEILDRKKNPLMKREEIVFSVDHGGKATPARKDLLKEISGKLKVKEDLLIIDKIFSATGKSQSNLKILVYKKKDDIPKGKLEKMKARMEKKKGKKPKEEAKPVEEVKPAEKKAEAEEEKPEEVKTEEKAEEPEKEEKVEEKAEEEKKGE
ncbi:MAG: hypothetical protein JSW41_01800 [Candidatus Aenigmatarchaeota archaeon]|nr:MAG: hypothetical protein JSW41_01800 [Candidatus Aenigmarchaeota archaeon]